MSVFTRLKYLVWSYGPTIVLILALLSITGVAATGWLQTHPQTTTVAENHDQQTAELTVETSALVRGESSLHPRGTTLRNKPFYIYDDSPTVSIITKTAIPRAEQGNITHRVILVYQVVSEDGVYWQRTRTLATERITGASGTTNATLNMSSVHDNALKLSQQVGDTARVVVNLKINSRYSTTKYTGAFSKTLSITHGSKTYSIPHESWTTTHSRTTEETITLSRPWWFKLGAMLPIGVGVLGLLVFMIVRRQIEDPAELEYLVERERYQEWISTGTVTRDFEVAAVVDSLEDLVDIAIDQNERVLYDHSENRYLVIADDAVYSFIPPADNIGSPNQTEETAPE